MGWGLGWVGGAYVGVVSWLKWRVGSYWGLGVVTHSHSQGRVEVNGSSALKRGPGAKGGFRKGTAYHRPPTTPTKICDSPKLMTSKQMGVEHPMLMRFHVYQICNLTSFCGTGLLYKNGVKWSSVARGISST